MNLHSTSLSDCLSKLTNMDILDNFNIKITQSFEQFIDKNDIVITDSNLFEIYKGDLVNNRIIVFEAGEDRKTLATVEKTCRKLVEHQADRSAKLVALGGGLVCDVTGLVASLYMRGVEFKFIATSLLAQLDASVGGKNGVNLDGYKNIIGLFNNPSLVVCALNTLNTLPKRELISGYAEAIKCGILADKELFDEFLKSEIDIESIVRKSLKIKAEIVTKDPFEKLGFRKLLNLGHTFGHAIEKCAPNCYLHGEAVAIGLAYAAKASQMLGFCTIEVADEIVGAIANVGLPTQTDINSGKLAQAILIDKKRDTDNIDLILIKNIGQPHVYPIKADISVIEEFLVSLRSI